MVEVERLTKYYGTFAAIQDVSFTAEKGQILGFLGPNGAGKTTTMRILTGYIPASSGTARVAGHDVFEESKEVRRRVGYLPETPPVYREMTPRTYLDFVARIKGVAKRGRNEAIDRSLEVTMTKDVANQPIGTLSRGYKQRVAIGQALIHDPEVLVLDEPTIGLDPKQIIEIRNLIRRLGADRTVILSTHILPEVTQICDKVVIISDGRIVAEEMLDAVGATEDLEAFFLQVTSGEAAVPTGGDGGVAAEEAPRDETVEELSVDDPETADGNGGASHDVGDDDGARQDGNDDEEPA